MEKPKTIHDFGEDFLAVNFNRLHPQSLFLPQNHGNTKIHHKHLT
jgi:hypothetical protein